MCSMLNTQKLPFRNSAPDPPENEEFRQSDVFTFYKQLQIQWQLSVDWVTMDGTGFMRGSIALGWVCRIGLD